MSFPVEIFDLFIDELASTIEHAESRGALLACTVVNRRFYRQASSYVFSSISISTLHSQKRLNDLRDILHANPDIAHCIRSFTVEAQVYTDSLHVVLRQLSRLREFRWISEHFSQFNWNKPGTPKSIVENLFGLPTLTALHFENTMYLPLSLFSSFCHLESLTLTDVGFASVEPDTLLAVSPPFSSLKRLKIMGALWSEEDVEAVKMIMSCAAPTLTTLVLSETSFMYCKSFFLDLSPSTWIHLFYVS